MILKQVLGTSCLTELIPESFNLLLQGTQMLLELVLVRGIGLARASLVLLT